MEGKKISYVYKLRWATSRNSWFSSRILLVLRPKTQNKHIVGELFGGISLEFGPRKKNNIDNTTKAKIFLISVKRKVRKEIHTLSDTLCLVNRSRLTFLPWNAKWHGVEQHARQYWVMGERMRRWDWVRGYLIKTKTWTRSFPPGMLRFPTVDTTFTDCVFSTRISLLAPN